MVIVMSEHDCELLSACCGAPPYMGMEETGICGACHDHTGFECEECGKAQDAS